MSKILFFGDIIGKPGREVLKKVLPDLRLQYQPDVVIVNVENAAHGKGVTLPIMDQLENLSIDAYTSGNHIFDKQEQAKEVFERFAKVVRPYNYINAELPGRGVYRFEKQGQWYAVVNLNGTVFFDKFPGGVGNAFFAFDELVGTYTKEGDIIIVDFHAEATSEKQALGWYLDGRVTAVLGTHTHVPSQDWKILSKGTALVTDVGMNGPVNSVIGVKIQNSLQMFLEQGKFIMEPEEEGPRMCNAVLIETENNKAIKIEKIYKIINS